MSNAADLSRSLAVPIVLQLVHERPMYGYEIIKIVNERTGGRFAWREGSLYPCLHRLEQAGHIEGFWQEGDHGKPRKYYRITRKGARQLQRDRASWSAFHASVNGILFGGAGA